MSAAQYETTSVKFEAAGHVFSAGSSKIVFEGFRNVYTEADEEKEQRAQDEVHEVLHQDVDSVLAPGKTGFAESEPRLHPEHQHSCKQHPDCIEGNSYIVHG